MIIYKYITLLSIFLFSHAISAQHSPITWTSELKKVSDTEYVLSISADPEKNWVIYSQFLKDDGPIPTEFKIEKKEGLKLVGNFDEPDDAIVKMDDMFGIMLTKFKGKTIFTQKLSSSIDLKEIHGTITFMTCDGTKCLPPETINFTAEIN
jgi:thiol:disulfide interchange protein DsbD